jgi:hypothetical protein
VGHNLFDGIAQGARAGKTLLWVFGKGNLENIC